MRPAASPRELAELLNSAAQSIVSDGTQSQRPVLEHVSAAAGQASPGAAAALVDWSGSEIARLRAFGIVHGVVLALDTDEQLALLHRIRGGTDLPLAG